MDPFDSQRLLEFYDRMGFRDLKRRIQNRINTKSQKPMETNSSISGRYDSILEDKKGTRSTSVSKQNSSFSERYDSILEDSNSNSTSSTDDPSVEGSSVGSQFGNYLEYKAPPEPDEFDDVPF